MRQGDDDYKGVNFPQTLSYPVPTHLAQRQQPWHDLGGHHTLSSARHETYHFDNSIPRDSLDFLIRSSYDHQGDRFKNKEAVAHQPELCELKHGNVFSNRIKSKPGKKTPLNHPLIVTRQAQKDDINSVPTISGATHSYATKRGYSRVYMTGGYFV